MPELAIAEESIDSSGALSLLYAAGDELRQRYGGDGDDAHLQVDDLRAPAGLFLVARLDGQLAGGVGLRAIGDAELHLGEVKRLWIRPDLRRRGLALALMNEVIDRARSRYRRLYLETGPLQPEAVALYTNSGWESVRDYPPGVFAHHISHRFTMEL